MNYLVETGRNLVGDLLELGHKEAVHVVGVRVVPFRQVQARVEPSFSELGETLDAEVEARRHELDVALLQGVVDDALVLLRKYGASGVNLKRKKTSKFTTTLQRLSKGTRFLDTQQPLR